MILQWRGKELYDAKMKRYQKLLFMSKEAQDELRIVWRALLESRKRRLRRLFFSACGGGSGNQSRKLVLVIISWLWSLTGTRGYFVFYSVYFSFSCGLAVSFSRVQSYRLIFQLASSLEDLSELRASSLLKKGYLFSSIFFQKQCEAISKTRTRSTPPAEQQMAKRESGRQKIIPKEKFTKIWLTTKSLMLITYFHLSFSSTITRQISKVSTTITMQRGLKWARDSRVALMNILNLQKSQSLQAELKHSPIRAMQAMIPMTYPEPLREMMLKGLKSEPWSAAHPAKTIPKQKKLNRNAFIALNLLLSFLFNYCVSLSSLNLLASLLWKNRQFKARPSKKTTTASQYVLQMVIFSQYSLNPKGEQSALSDSIFPSQAFSQGRSAVMKPQQQLTYSPKVGQSAMEILLMAKMCPMMCPWVLEWVTVQRALMRKLRKRMMVTAMPKMQQQVLQTWLMKLLQNSGLLRLYPRVRSLSVRRLGRMVDSRD